MGYDKLQEDEKQTLILIVMIEGERLVASLSEGEQSLTLTK